MCQLAVLSSCLPVFFLLFPTRSPGPLLRYLTAVEMHGVSDTNQAPLTVTTATKQQLMQNGRKEGRK